jgi:hypothetical protein
VQQQQSDADPRGGEQSDEEGEMHGSTLAADECGLTQI